MSALLPRPSILSIEPYVGGESKIPGVNRIIKLSSNEGAFGVPPGAQAAYAKLAAELHRYPDGGSTALRNAIGARFGLAAVGLAFVRGAALMRFLRVEFGFGVGQVGVAGHLGLVVCVGHRGLSWEVEWKPQSMTRLVRAV